MQRERAGSPKIPSLSRRIARQDRCNRQNTCVLLALVVAGRIGTARMDVTEGKQKRRARKLGPSLHYDLEGIRVSVINAIGKPCPYRGVVHCVTNFSLDHADPTNRGGRHCLDNMIVYCERCDQTKGPLTAQEFQALLDFLRTGDFFVAKNVLARMRAAGKFFRC